MKLLNINLARSIWLFQLNDLNPLGKAFHPDLDTETRDRYSFKDVSTPRQRNEKDSKEVIFSDGIFTPSHGTPIQIKLTVYADGIMADSRSSTADCDEFLENLLNWITTKFELVSPTDIEIQRVYVSEANISFDTPLNAINPKLTSFLQELSGNLKSPVPEISFELGALGFWIDPALKAQHVAFRVERAATVPFSKNRYYSIAPLQTDVHLKALGTLESICNA